MNQSNIFLKLSKEEHLELIFSIWHNWLQKISDSEIKKYQLEEYQKLSLADLELLQEKLQTDAFYLPNSRLNLFIAASTVPITLFKEILNSFLLKSPIICRLPKEFELNFYKLFEKILPDNLKTLAQFVFWESHNLEVTKEFIQKSDSVIVHGNNETINFFKALTTEKHFLGFGHKASFAVCKPILADIPALVSDIEAFEQKGCLSPQVIYCLEENENTITNFAQNLNFALEKACKNFYLKAALAYQRQNFLEQMALDQENQIIGKHVVFSKNPQFEYSIGGGLVWIKPLKNLFDLKKAVNRLNGFIGTIGTNLSPISIQELFADIRICELGKMQKPSLLWLQKPTYYSQF